VGSDWGATPDHAGVAALKDLSSSTAGEILERVARFRRPGDIVVASIHWGDNWGYEISQAQTSFARQLIDLAGFDVIHGHSSHHPKAIEIHEGRPILYGCGDFLNDYEGIEGYEAFRDDLVLMYLPTLSASNGRLVELRLIPFQIRNFRLNRPSRADAAWLRDTIDRESRKFGIRTGMGDDGTFAVTW
jgi:poly-gamma-glutamate synthesis protein (capsule biosynthesis protein)